MANIVFNIGLGRFTEYYNRVKGNDPAPSAFILIPIETAGLETDAVLRDVATVTALLAGTTNEQTTMGRKTLTDAELAAFPGPDNALDRYDLSLPTVTWTAATGNAISKIAVCYDADTGAGTDANIIPLLLLDEVFTPDGSDISILTGVVFRATSAA